MRGKFRLQREQREVEEIPEEEAREVLEVFEAYGLTRQEAVPIVDSLRQRPKQWIDFMMRFELGLEPPDPKRALRSASTIATALHQPDEPNRLSAPV